ncbi:hypothetical protein DL766_003899 [Monosporascus sp. MC13-8B]|uniref:WSC domain-containing protein n=1 Tax=Monosporascus cannonballus TaxID=155416 RepID=A0ABY0HKT8_9PEZI|nr:hypothetical protein DL762_001408 [Monosporascus cannonballus]RYP00979.1 hypothetical protein DL763_000400 [Monosporascus cannonballus]RYP32574.1 hypothetical protein DL766_003899 [Monosporascus sp. MC13-8B]
MAFSMRTLSFAAIVALMGNITPVLSLDMAFCARFNTASSGPHFNIWQSNGLCHDTCQGSAFAIVQDNNCWCSDYEPADSVTTDVGDCNTNCPGYPDENCGGDGLFGYMALGPEPAGTRGASSSNPTTKARSTTTEVTTTVENGFTTTVLATVTLVPTPSDKTTSATPAPAPTTTQETTERTTAQETTERTTAQETTERTTKTQPPTTSVETITAGGTTLLQTVTVMPTLSSSAAVDSGNDTLGTTPEPHHGIPTGAAVGIAVGILGFLAILSGIGVFFWLRRRRLDQEAAMERSNSGRGSSAGMMSTPRTEMASIWDEQSMNRRNSRIMPHDPRMDPFAGNLYSQFGNKSRESINTIQDNQDYSRKVLRTTNPDPPEE